jgi:hypothetical protein
VKLNITPRIGLVADFSGHYGERGVGATSLNQFTPPWRENTWLFGPEFQVLKAGRITVNARGLFGIANTNGLPASIAPRILFALDNNRFAASVGGSIDYRVTNRLSWRVIQPEALITNGGNTGTDHWNQYNFTLASGLVWSAGQFVSNRSTESLFSFGVVGGAALTDAFPYHVGSSFMGLAPVVFSNYRDYVIGVMTEARLPWPGLSVEVNALYRPMNLTTAGMQTDGSLNGVSPATVVTWQVPVLAKYRFGSGLWKPFIEAGPSFRASGNINNASPSIYGGTAGVGVEASLGRLKVSPVIRYTHWAADSDDAGSRTGRNQVELLVGVSF